MSTLRLKSLDGVKVGKGLDSQVVHALLAGVTDDANGIDLVQGLGLLADTCAVDSWAVYRWLRGIHSPRRRAMERLRALAAERGIEIPAAAA